MEILQQPEVFISYSHDNEVHKNWVLQLASRLRSNSVNIILDRWNLTLGSNLAHFMEKGLSRSTRVICICSEEYVKKSNEAKGGVGYEKMILTAELIKDQNNSSVIPLIRNNPGLNKTPIFLNGHLYISFEDDMLYESKYEELLRNLLDEPVLPIPPIGPNPFKTIKEYAQHSFIPSSEKYISPATFGSVTFDYSNNNGSYNIGQAELMFELKFSKASGRCIHLYNDPDSIRTIAVCKNISSLKEIQDARDFDISSRARSVSVGQFAVIQNENGFYAAIKITAIEDDSQGAINDLISFVYVIQTNGSPDFSKVTPHILTNGII